MRWQYVTCSENRVLHPGSMLTVLKMATSLRTALRAAVVKEAAVAATTVGEYKSPCRLGRSNG